MFEQSDTSGISMVLFRAAVVVIFVVLTSALSAAGAGWGGFPACQADDNRLT
jgi:hypothetical protein